MIEVSFFLYFFFFNNLDIRVCCNGFNQFKEEEKKKKRYAFPNLVKLDKKSEIDYSYSINHLAVLQMTIKNYQLTGLSDSPGTKRM